jgi:hypothetical protein
VIPANRGPNGMGPLTAALLARTALFSGGIDRGSAGETVVRSRTERHVANHGLPVQFDLTSLVIPLLRSTSTSMRYTPS